MSMVLAAHEMVTTVLAQVGNPTPETPPAADKLLKLVRYFTWFVLLSGVIGITYGAAGSPGRSGPAAAWNRRRWWRAR